MTNGSFASSSPAFAARRLAKNSLSSNHTMPVNNVSTTRAISNQRMALPSKGDWRLEQARTQAWKRDRRDSPLQIPKPEAPILTSLAVYLQHREERFLRDLD